MPIYLLLAMQAAGMVVDYYGNQQQQRMGRMGLKIQQAGIEANIYSTRAETEQESLQAMIDLRKNMGTQIAVNAARGTSTAGGSALALFTESLGNFNSDERMRRMNLLTRENELRAGGRIAALNQSSSNAKMWQGFAQRSFNTVSSNPSLYGFGKQAPKTKSSYGLTPVGG